VPTRPRHVNIGMGTITCREEEVTNQLKRFDRSNSTKQEDKAAETERTRNTLSRNILADTVEKVVVIKV
jgi:hypothetical protein